MRVRGGRSMVNYLVVIDYSKGGHISHTTIVDISLGSSLGS